MKGERSHGHNCEGNRQNPAAFVAPVTKRTCSAFRRPIVFALAAYVGGCLQELRRSRVERPKASAKRACELFEVGKYFKQHNETENYGHVKPGKWGLF